MTLEQLLINVEYIAKGHRGCAKTAKDLAACTAVRDIESNIKAFKESCCCRPCEVHGDRKAEME